ncbi:sulfide-quinone oxidoreductase, partial [Ancistrocladus abbreviatus]
MGWNEGMIYFPPTYKYLNNSDRYAGYARHSKEKRKTLACGNYGDAMSLDLLKDFHWRRVKVLAESGADLIAFETTPNKVEAQAYTELLDEEDIKIPAWISFNSKDGVNVVSGDSLLECASIAETCKKVTAVGINCTTPRFIHDVILSVKK